jgi:hypothetical protein
MSDDDLIVLEPTAGAKSKSGEQTAIVIGAGACITNFPSNGPSTLAHNEADGRQHHQHDIHFLVFMCLASAFQGL